MEVNMMQKINENQTMITLQIRPYVKVVILQVTDFISFVVDEQNFAKDDAEGIKRFRSKYENESNCIIVETQM